MATPSQLVRLLNIWLSRYADQMNKVIDPVNRPAWDKFLKDVKAAVIAKRGTV